MSLNFYEWVNAAGYTAELPFDSKKYFSQYGGSSIAQAIQEIGKKDPLVITAPNHLRIPMLNPYVLDWGRHLTLPTTMSDPDTTGTLGYGHSLFRHGYGEVLEKGKKYIDDTNNVLYINDYNPLYTRNRDNVQEFKELLETIATGPFKDYPWGKQLAKWLCDSFMAITKDPNTERFNNMGFFGVAMSNGAVIDFNKIKALISKLDPKKAGVPTNDIYAGMKYIQQSELYRELYNTNKYFALSSTIHQFWNKSDISRSNLYTNPNSVYLKALSNLIANRNTINMEADAQFLNSITDMYYKSLNTSDANKYITQKDETRLMNVCNRYFTNINAPISK